MPNSIKNWAVEDRPREKLLNLGKENLSKSELLAIILRSGYREKSALKVAQQILNKCNQNLNELGKLSINDLCEFKGIGEAKAITLIATIELGKRRLLEDVYKKNKISCSKDIFDIIYPHLSDKKEEEFWMICLNNKLNILSNECMSKGGLTETTVDIRLIFKRALEQNATQIIVAHNHPSGNNHPSENDKKITNNIKEAGKILNIKLIDHLIVAENNYFSFADKELI